MKRFNWAARKLCKRLVQLGANETYLSGEADQQHPEGYVDSQLPYVYTRGINDILGWREHLFLG